MDLLWLGRIVLIMSSSAGMVAAAAPPDVPLIPRAALFGNPVRAQARLSPDGRYISFLAPRDGVLNVWYAPYDQLDAAKPLTRDTGRGIREHFWAANGRHILYLQDEGGDENWRVHSVDIETGKEADLTPLKDVQAQIVGLSYKHPDRVLVGLNDREPEWHDLYSVDVRSGERTLVERNDEQFAGYLADLDLKPRLALRTLPEGGGLMFRRAGDGWEQFLAYGQEDSLTTQPVVIEASADTALLISSVDRDKAALVRVDLGSGKQTLLGGSEKADVSGVWLEPKTRAPQAFAVEYLRTELTPLQPHIGKDIALLEKTLGHEFEITSRTLDDRKWIAVVDDPVKVLSTWLYDRDTGKITRLFDQRPELADAPLQPMQTHEIRARDGLTLTAYVTLPAGTRQPVPMVLIVHGGPWARDSYGFDPESQWLANRGYAVLSVNFRGSTGFGKAFVNAGDHEWGRKMHDDLIDAVRWAIERKIAVPDKVAIYGGSYGGYAALAGLTFTPQTFACGVDIVGPSNLITLLESIPPYWKAFFDDMARRIGDPRTEEGRKLLAERSPLNFVERIERPLLIAQGANDPRVKKAESDQIVNAMREKNLPVTYTLYPDEGHGFARPQNRLSFYAVAEGFLSACLGGRFQPIGDDFAGSSIQVPVGAQHVPGLAEALRALEASPEARSHPESADQSRRQ